MKYTVSYHALTLQERIVKDYLDDNNIAYNYSPQGEIELLNSVSADRISGMQYSLSRYGIEFVQDEPAIVVQRIKNALAELAYSDKPLLKTLSCHLSEVLGLSYAHLANCFNRGAAFSIEQYFILLKIERAKRLILEDELTLKEVSLLLHYSSPGHLCKQFKKMTGISVTAFRNVIRIKKDKME